MSVLMRQHEKRSLSKQKRLFFLHALVGITYTLMSAIGLYYFRVSIYGFTIIICFSVAIYLIGMLGLRKIVKRFELGDSEMIPDKRVTCLHFCNMTLFLVSMLVATGAQILMVRLFDGANNLV